MAAGQPMSVESLSIAFNHSRASGTARILLLGIANHDGDGGAWPSNARLRRYSGITDRKTIQRAIERLEKLGEIRVHVQGGGTPGMAAELRPNLYEFRLTCPPNCDRTSGHNPIDKGLPIVWPEGALEQHERLYGPPKNRGASAPRGADAPGSQRPGGGGRRRPPNRPLNPDQDSEKNLTFGDARASACPQSRDGHRWGPGGFCTNGCGIELDERAAS